MAFYFNFFRNRNNTLRPVMIIHTLIELLVIIAMIAILAELVETTVGAVYADSACRGAEAKAMLAQNR